MSKKSVNKNIVQKKPPGQTDPFPGKWIFLLGASILTVVVFSNSLVKEFVELDDHVYILENPYIKSLSWPAIVKIFSVFYNGNYHPLTTLLYALEYNKFGLNALFYHIVSLAFHVLNVCLVYLFLEKLNLKREVAIIGSLLFAIHPMHVESVVWVAEQKDVLYSFFYLSGLIVYVDYVKRNSFKRLFLVLFLFLLSLLSKSAAVTFPLILLSIDYYLQRRWEKKIILEKIPFFLLAALFGIVAILSQHAAGAISGDTMVPYSPVQRFFVVSYALVYYIVKLVLPIDLCVLHYAPSKLPFYFYLCPLVLTVIVFLILKSKQMRRTLIFGFLFYLFSILLVIQIIPIGFVIVSERYSYVPYIGLFIILGSLYLTLMSSKNKSIITVKPFIKYLMASVIILFSFMTFQYNKKWKNSTTLFTDIVEKNPTSAYAYNSLAKVQVRASDTLASYNSFTKAISLDSTLTESYFCRGNIYLYRKEYDLAVKDYLKAGQLNPKYTENFNNLAFLYSETGRMDEAIECYAKSISIQPSEYLYKRRGTCLMIQKRYEEALQDYSSAMLLNAESGENYYNRGVCYYYLNQIDKACDDWKKASSLGFDKAVSYLGSYCK